MSQMKTYLRAYEPSDWSLLNKWHNDENVFSNTMANKYFISSERDKVWAKNTMIKDSENIFWAICFCDNDEMIGSTSLLNIDLRNKKANIGGITIDQKYQDQKYGLEATFQVFEYAFNELGLNKISAAFLDTQTITAHGAKKFGFVEELRLREEIYKLGRFHDVIVASLFASVFNSGLGK